MLRHRVSASSATPALRGSLSTRRQKNGEEREGSSLRPGFVEPELVGSSYLGATRVAVEARMAQADGCD